MLFSFSTRSFARRYTVNLDQATVNCHYPNNTHATFGIAASLLYYLVSLQLSIPKCDQELNYNIWFIILSFEIFFLHKLLLLLQFPTIWRQFCASIMWWLQTAFWLFLNFWIVFVLNVRIFIIAVSLLEFRSNLYSLAFSHFFTFLLRAPFYNTWTLKNQLTIAFLTAVYHVGGAVA